MRKGKTLLILLLLTAAMSSRVQALTDDLYNTAEISSDLSWTKKPGDSEGFSEVSGGNGKGQTVRTYEVCNSEGKTDVEHWLRSPYIDAQSAKRVNLEISFSIYECKDCRETFTLYYYPAESDLSTSTFPPWNDDLYQKIDTVAADKRFDGNTQTDSVNVKTLVIGPLERRGIYLAIRDQGACMSILKVRLYYHYCPQITRNLAHFARTVVGAKPASLVAVDGTCTANAVSKSEVPRYYCNTNGEWTVPTGSCHCDRGYQQDRYGRCRACPGNTYKWSVGNGTCMQCPSHSKSTETGSSFCQCIKDYYRIDDNSATQECRKIPSSPNDMKYKLTKNGVQVSWKAPTDDQSSRDVFYRISCEKCDNTFGDCQACPASVQFYPTSYTRLTVTDVLLSDLDQFSFYKIKVFSYNGVSQKSGKEASFSEVRFSTSETVPSAVRDVVLGETSSSSLTLYWSEPESENGAIVGYEVQVKPLGVVSSRTYPFPSLQVKACNATVKGLDAGTSYQVMVRAQTSAGAGQFSEAEIFTTAQEVEPESSSVAVIAIAICAVAVLAVAVFCLVRYRRSSKQSKENERVSAKLSSSTPAARLVVSTGKNNQAMSTQITAGRATRKTYVDYRDPHKGVKEIAQEIELSKIKIHTVIGQGEFGEVCRGQIVEKKKKPIDVAIKRLKDGASIVDQTNFLREACTMAQFHDPNIVQLKGVVTKHMPAMIVTEYMENGSLDKYLQKRKGELSVIDLLKMQRGVASGMKYLANMKYVHRDLAARNILIDSKHCCKVSDFGLSRTLENDPNATYTTQGGKIALRWTAPECIRYRKFTSASDVWSYGIVMWEIMSYGEKPYWDMNNDGVQQMIEDGYRLPCPGECPRTLHDLMLKCWSADPHRRPTFDQIHQIVDKFISKPSVLKPTVPRPYLAPDPASTNSLQHLLSSDDNASEMSAMPESIDEWLETVRLAGYGHNFHASGIRDLNALTSITASDLERLGIVSPEHRSRLESGIYTLRRHLNQRRPSNESTEEEATTFAPHQQQQPQNSYQVIDTRPHVFIPLQPLPTNNIGGATSNHYMGGGGGRTSQDHNHDIAIV